MLLFGFATTFPQAVMGRLVSGILCGNLGVLKTFLTEITDSSNRGGGFAILSMSWSIGTVFSPLIGGMLSKPCQLYPSVFPPDDPNSWLGVTFTKYPYLLPSVTCCLINMFSALCILCFLKETKTGATEGGIETGNSADATATDGGKYSGVALDSVHGSESESGGEVDLGSGMDLDDYDEVVEMVDLSREEEGVVRNPAFGKFQRLEERGDNENENENGFATRMSTSSSSNSSSDGVSLIFRRNVQLAVGSYGLLALGQIILDETLPLYMKLDRPDGGFAYDTNEIGEVLSLAGLIFTGM